MRSLTTRRPEGSSVSRWSLMGCCGRAAPRRRAGRCTADGAWLPALGGAVGARGRTAARPVAVAPAPALAAVAVPVAPAAPALAAAAARAAVAGADADELGRRLALDLRVVGEAQADAAALPVHLDHADLELLALLEDLLDRRGTLARRDVGDVQQAVRALGELDEGAERHGLDDLAGELVADLDLLGHGADAVDQRVALGARRRVHPHLAGVVDVDLRLVL